MNIDSQTLIDRQLSITKPTDETFSNGQKTPLTPSRWLPVPTGEGSRLSLDGKWKVRLWPFVGSEKRLVAAACGDGKWDEVQQPGKVLYYDPEADLSTVKNWNRVGLDHIDPEDGAIIRKKITIPKRWAGKEIFLQCDAIYPAGRVYCNGKLLGEHTSGCTPVQYRVTEFVTPGKVAVIAIRLLAKHRFVKMDMPRHAMEFTGLAESASLFCVGPVHVGDYHFVTSVDHSLRTGTVVGKVVVRNEKAKSVRANLLVSLLDEDAKLVGLQKIPATLAGGGSREVEVSIVLKMPKLWNDEYPHLYTVRIELAVPTTVSQVIQFRTGFRRLDLSPDGPRLNGSFIKFRGVNHLGFHPQHGLYTPPDWLRQNLLLMKKANVNTIRTHLMCSSMLAGLCDELGFYLVQEIPIDWGTNYIHDPEWVGPALFRIEGSVRRDRHNPSIMVWGVGNENMPQDAKVAADGWNHLRLYDRFVKTLDPSRPTMFPPPGPANKISGIFELRIGDIADTHYSFKLARDFLKTGKIINPNSWEADMVEQTRDSALAGGWSGTWFSSEYGAFNMIPDLHNAPYNSILSDLDVDYLSGQCSQQVFIDRMRDEWGFLRHEASCLGGAYFPWICGGAGHGAEGNPWGWVRLGEDADWGVVTADLLPKPFFWVLRTFFSPVWFPAWVKWKDGDKSISFEISNHYNQIDLSNCTLRVQMGGGGRWMTMMRGFQDVPVSCRPGETKSISIPLWNKDSLKGLENGTPVIVRCHLLDPRGFRPITADIMVLPPQIRRKDGEVPIGPDAIIQTMEGQMVLA